MPVNPGDGEGLAARVARLVDATEVELLRILAQLIREGADRDDWSGLQGAQAMLWEAQKAGRALTPQVRQAILDEILAAMNIGTATALNDLPDDAPVVTGNVWRATVEAAGVQANVSDALGRMPGLLVDAYRRATAAGAAQVLGGRLTRLQASQSVLDDLLSQGIRGYRDRAGRNWALDTFVEMSVRTVTGQAAVTAHTEQLAHAGRDLVIVSDSPRQCPLCRPWEGKVLSISGAVGAVIVPSRTTGDPVRVQVAGTVAQARAAGLMHPNCRHGLSSFIPGVTRRRAPRQDPAAYEASQRQRAMERKIREWKRRTALALTDEQAAYASGKAREWTNALRDHVDANDLKRLRYRERVGAPDAPLAH